MLDHLTAAEPNDATCNHAPETHVKGVVEDLEVDCAELITPVSAIELAVLLDVLLLSARELNNIDPDEVFLHVLIKGRHGVTNKSKDFPHRDTKGDRRDRRHGQRHQHHAGQRSADCKHGKQRHKKWDKFAS